MLHFADPSWLCTMRNGAAFLLAYVLVRIVVGVVTAWTPLTSQWLWPTIDVLGLVALFCVTRAEPAPVEQEPPLTLRRTLRVAKVVDLVGYAWMFPKVAATIPAAIGNTIVGLSTLFVTVGLLIHLRRLARRIPDAVLVSNTTAVLFGLGLSRAFSIATLLTVSWFGRRALKGLVGQQAYTAISTVCGCGMLVFGIWFLIILVHYLIAFRRAMAQASGLQEKPKPESKST